MIGFVCARSVRVSRGVLVAGVVSLMCTAMPQLAEASGSSDSAFNSYGASYRMIDLPPVSGGSFSTVGDALPDGRLVSTTGNGVYLETGVGTGAFDLVSTIDTGPFGSDPDPAFLRISPDGSRIALGGGFGKPLAVFSTSELGTPAIPTKIDASNTAHFDVNHFDAEWMDNNQLGITAGKFGDPSFVSLLDVTSPTAAPVNPIIINNINGASGGIAFDSAGRLFTGNGFDSGIPGLSETGSHRIFEPSDWSIASPADFEVDGVYLGDILSASSLSMDSEGNLAVGGGDFAEGMTGFMGVISAQAIKDAMGGVPVDPNDPMDLRRLDPLNNGLGFFGSSFNAFTGELFVTDGAKWWATAPSPGPAAALVIFALDLSRRRKRAA